MAEIRTEGMFNVLYIWHVLGIYGTGRIKYWGFFCPFGEKML